MLFNKTVKIILFTILLILLVILILCIPKNCKKKDYFLNWNTINEKLLKILIYQKLYLLHKNTLILYHKI